MGSPDDFVDMLKFVEDHKVEPVIDATYTFDNAHEGIKALEQGKQFGKLILDITG
jgi:zinc-binding alcohol dehydrogenase/oxidoreductase